MNSDGDGPVVYEGEVLVTEFAPDDPEWWARIEEELDGIGDVDEGETLQVRESGGRMVVRTLRERDG